MLTELENAPMLRLLHERYFCPVEVPNDPILEPEGSKA